MTSESVTAAVEAMAGDGQANLVTRRASDPTRVSGEGEAERCTAAIHVSYAVKAIVTKEMDHARIKQQLAFFGEDIGPVLIQRVHGKARGLEFLLL